MKIGARRNIVKTAVFLKVMLFFTAPLMFAQGFAEHGGAAGLNGQIVFTAFTGDADNPGPHLFLADPETGNVRQLTNMPPMITDPVWSPNGRWIACWSGTEETVLGGDVSVLLIDPASGRVENVSGSEYPDYHAVWGPQSEIIYYVSIREGEPGIYRFSLATRKTSEVVSGKKSYQSPAVSPDGSTIVCSINSDLYSFNVDGTGERRLTSLEGIETAPQFVPGENTVIFSHLIYGSSSILALDPESGKERVVIEGRAGSGYPSVSPDGRVIAFSRLAAESVFDGSVIALADLEGAGMREITSGGAEMIPAFSPDGEKIAFLGSHQNEKGRVLTDVFIVNRDGSGLTNLTRSAEKSFTPRGMTPRSWGVRRQSAE
jgi:Tol biopolymer transport system component